MMPITRREGLDWAVKATTVLAFLASIECAYAASSLATSESALETYEPNTTTTYVTPRLIGALIVYVLIVHVLALMTCLRSWRMLFTRSSLAAHDDVRQVSCTTSGDRQLAEFLLADFKNEELKKMCRVRNLPTSGRKAELVQAFLGSRSRANDSQFAQISNLLAGNHRLVIGALDLDSVAAATSWLRIATAGQPRQRTNIRAA